MAGTDGDKMEFAGGVTKVGSFQNRYTIYKNPYMKENIVLLGFRGSNFLETGAVYAPYIPLILTPLVYDPNNFTPRRGVMTRYAKKVVRPEFFGTALLSDKNEVRVLDMADLDGSQNVRMIMRYTAGVQFGIGSDIVLYSSLV